MKILIATSIAVLSACSSMNYKPVSHNEFQTLAEQGCAVPQSRFNLKAQVSAAYKETLVLWDGVDASRTVAVRLPKEGMKSKAQGLVGSSRYEVNLEVMQRIRDEKSQIEVALECKKKDKAPNLLRLRYNDGGEDLVIEFEN